MAHSQVMHPALNRHQSALRLGDHLHDLFRVPVRYRPVVRTPYQKELRGRVRSETLEGGLETSERAVAKRGCDGVVISWEECRLDLDDLRVRFTKLASRVSK